MEWVFYVLVAVILFSLIKMIGKLAWYALLGYLIYLVFIKMQLFSTLGLDKFINL